MGVILHIFERSVIQPPIKDHHATSNIRIVSDGEALFTASVSAPRTANNI